MSSFEAWLESVLYKIKWLGITNDAAATNFAAHVGWSIAIPMVAHAWLGNWGLWVVTALFFVETLLWKLFTWGYIEYFKAGTLPPVSNMDVWNDFYMDFISRLTVSVVMSLWYLFKI